MNQHQPRRPKADDAAAVYALISARDTAVIGRPDMTFDDVVDELSEFDLERDCWLWETADGTVLTYCWVQRKADSDMVDFEVIERPGTEGERTDQAWSLVLRRAGELGEEAGHQSVTADIGIFRADGPKQALAASKGFEASTSFHRLRVDHEKPVTAPELPAGVTLHTGVTDEVRRQAYDVHQKGFAEHFGFVPVTFEEWFSRRDAQSTTDWSQVTVARVDGEPAAVLIGTDHFVSDENCGYVITLATLPDYRGRGLGRLLLRTAFAADAERGRTGTILHVDANNTTPALGLYESVGMRPVMVFDMWRKRL